MPPALPIAERHPLESRFGASCGKRPAPMNSVTATAQRAVKLPLFLQDCLKRYLVVLLLAAGFSAGAADAQTSVEFQIKRQDLGTALLDFSYQSNVQVVMPGFLAEGLLAEAVTGRYTPSEALDRLLSNTGLEYTFTGPRTVTIEQRSPDTSELARRRLERLGLEQLFVVGEERRDPTRDVTVSAAVLNGEDLESRGVTRADELQQFVPGLTVESPHISNTEFRIRGAGVSNDNIFVPSGVGIYIDEVRIPRQGAANMSLYELERVEVRRGPQSILYGPYSTAGALVYVTRKPSPDFEARYQVDMGTRGRLNNVLAVNGEMADRVYGQVALASFQRDPIMRNFGPGEGKGNNLDARSARAGLRAEPSETVEWLFSIDAERTEQDGALYSIGPSGPFRFAEALPPAPASDPVRSANVDVAGGNRQEISGLLARVNVKTDTLWSSYIVGRRFHELTELHDMDQTPLALVNRAFDEDADSITLEARWMTPPREGRFHQGELAWLAGVAVLQENAEAARRIEAPGLAAGVNRWRQSLDQVSYLGYAQADYGVTSRLRLIAGLRYTADLREFDVSASTTQPGPANPYVRAPLDFSTRRDWRRLTPRLAAHFHYSPDTAFYASLSGGYKPGGYPGSPADPAEAGRAFAHERVSAYEFGVRSKWFGNRMKFNAAVFHADHSDMQITAHDAVGKSLVTNAAQAELSGFEMEIQARPLPALKIGMGLSFIDARFERFVLTGENGEPVDKAGDRVPRVPDATFNFSTVYLFPETTHGSWSVRADAIFSDEAQDVNSDPAWPEYRSYNLWLDFLARSGKWEAALWVRNLRDKVYFQAGSPGLSAASNAFARKLEPPRVAGLSLKYYW